MRSLTLGRRPRGGVGHNAVSSASLLTTATSIAAAGRSLSKRFKTSWSATPTLIVLDGLDEVGDPRLRSDVVNEIDRLTKRLGAVNRRMTQIVVTTRPNSSSQPEPSRGSFEYVRLRPMNADMQREYLRKWAAVNGISGTRRRKLMRVFVGRTAEEHIAQLSSNPMHLTILLYLINKRGEAVPTGRTAIYTAYMDALMDREVERDQVDKDDVPRVHETTSWLGWKMQAGVEKDPSLGRLPVKRIRSELFNYLQEVEGPENLLDKLFRASSDRFWALTSKEGETFEFAVQPVREYFAARYLAKYAGMLTRQVLKGDLLADLVQRSYWLNTTLFYAGFADPNEVSGLVGGIQDALESGRHPAQVRVALWALLRDGVFSSVKRSQRQAVGLLIDDLGLRLISPEQNPEQFPEMPEAHGAEDLVEALLCSVKGSDSSTLNRARLSARLLGEVGPKSTGFPIWLTESLRTANGSEQERLLLVGAAHGRARLDAATSDSVRVSGRVAQAAALTLGACPTPGSSQDKALIASVLNGQVSDTSVDGTATAASLLRAVRPHRFIELAKGGDEPRFLIPTAHMSDAAADARVRQQVFSRLSRIDPRYQRVKQSSLFRRAEQGSTAPWQNTAREIAAIHGPCWLATEIALIGVANGGVRTGGSISPNKPPLGHDMDYGVFVQTMRAGQGADWWIEQEVALTDSTSRMAWCGGLLTTGDHATICQVLPIVQDVLQSLSEDEYWALVQGLSRISASGLGRKMYAGVTSSDRWFGLGALTTSGPTRLLAALALFAADLKMQDPLPELGVDDLVAITGFGPASWPAHRALTARLLSAQTQESLQGVASCGPDAVVVVPDKKPSGFPAQHVQFILANPLRFPLAWVEGAERWHSRENAERPLGEVGRAEGWLPNL